MSQPYIGEIRMFAGNFAPAGWAMCNGALMAISENDTLFNLIGTTYGGDGQQTFGLPNLQSRVPVHQGPGFALAQAGGAESVALTAQTIPAHSHSALGSAAGTQLSPSGGIWAASASGVYSAAGPGATPMSNIAIGFAGNSQPHNNMLPYLCVNFILSLFGIFPSQT